MSKIDRDKKKDQKAYNRKVNAERYGRYWLVYVGLAVTAGLSVFAGMSLPFKDGYVTFWRIIAALYYAAGFVATGEGAAYFWFDKLTDRDEDNKTQIMVAWTMLLISVATILTTALAAGSFIAYYLGAMEIFTTLPYWAQEWIVWAIPVLLIVHMVSGMLFRAVSDEAAAEREMKVRIRLSKEKVQEEKMNARANYWENHAPDVAKQLGELEAQEEIARYRAKLGAAMASETKQENPKNS